MLKAELNKYLGLEVTVVLYDDSTLNGVLGYVPIFSEKYNWKTPNYYYIDNYNFRASHVKQLYVNENVNITKAY